MATACLIMSKVSMVQQAVVHIRQWPCRFRTACPLRLNSSHALATRHTRSLRTAAPFDHKSSKRHNQPLCVAAVNDDDLLRQYSVRKQESPQKAPLGAASQSGNALFILIMANLAIFVFDHVLNQGWTKLLYLNHSAPRWWQFITSAFSHGSWQHLSSNLFGLYVFGREVETDGGALGVTATYLITAVGAGIASVLVLPRNSLSLGASGAVFGMYAVSVLLKLSSGFSLKKIVEAGILGQFVFTQVQQELVSQSRLIGSGAVIGASGVSHVAHLAGAAVGVILIVLLSRLPVGSE